MLIGICKCWCNKYCLMVCLLLCSHFTAAELQATQGWVKLAPPGANANAAYVQLYNPGANAVVINAFSANCCASLMLHRTRYENDRAIMEHLDQLSVPAKGRVAMAPGGLHIMLLQAAAPLRVGDTVQLQLHFSDGRQQTIQLPVQADEH